MIIKPSSVLRNRYNEISQIAKESKEPIYITNHGESDLIVMNVDAYERREQALTLRSKILIAEESRLNGALSIKLEEAERLLDQRLEDFNAI